MRRLVCVIFILTIVVVSKMVLANDFLIKQFSIKEGLSQVSVLTSLKDHKGYMWFGTRNGLNRFDGHNFEKFVNKPNDTTSLSNNFIYSIIEDRNNRIWVGTEGGLCLYNELTNSFIRFGRDQNEKNTISHNSVVKLFCDSRNRIWVGTVQGLNLYDEKSGGFIPVSNCKTTEDENYFITSIYEDHKGTIWVGTQNNGLKLFNESKTCLENFSLPNISTPLNSVTLIVEDENDNLWLGTDGYGMFCLEGFYKLSEENVQIRKIYTEQIKKVRCGWYDDNRNIWLGTYNGLYLLSTKTKRFSQVNIAQTTGVTPDNKSIRSLCIDENNNVWIGTYFDGVLQLYENHKGFKHYSKNLSGLASNLISAFAEDKNGNLWIGSEDGDLNMLERKTNVFCHFKIGNETDGMIPPIKSMIFDDEERLWVATSFNGVRVFDPKTKKLTIVQSSSKLGKELPVNNLEYLCFDKDKQLWIGTNNDGIIVYNPKEETFVSYKSNADDSSSLSENMIITLFKDRKDRMWIGTRSGILDEFCPNTNSFKHHLTNLSEDFVKPMAINGIYEDKNGDLWLASKGGGLIQYNPEMQKLKQYLTNDGFPSNTFNKIVKDKIGNLWISHPQGVCSFNKETYEINNYDYFSGIPIREFTLNSLILRHNNEICVGGIDGFISFYPANIRINTFVPSVIFQGLKVHNDRVLPNDGTNILSKPLDETEEIVLNHDQSRFTFEFVALNYIDPEHNKYTYILEGFDEEWHDVQNKRYASYSSLPAGEYVFRVKALNNDGIWNHQDKHVRVRILPPWWLTWWAILLYVLFGLMIISLIFAYFLYRQSMRNKLKIKTIEVEKAKEFSEMRNKLYANVSHEFFTPLSLITAPLESMIEKTQTDLFLSTNLEYVRQNTQRLVRLVKQLLTFQKMENGYLQLLVQPINMVQYLTPIHKSFKQLAKRHGINLSFVYKNEDIAIWADPTQLEHVYYNLLSNAFKYTPEDGEITLEISESPEQICISVKDSGTGMTAEQTGRIFDRYYQTDSKVQWTSGGMGIGLSFSKAILEQHNGRIGVESQIDQGTVFKTWLKKGNEHFQGRSDVKIIESTKNRQQISHEDEKEEAKKVTPANEKGQKNGHILLVEDNKELSMFIKNYLSPHFNVTSAYHGKQALELISKHRPDLIISDVMMPVMDGISFCNNVKSSDEFKDIPIILLTAKIAEEDIKKGLSTGAEDYMTKPFSLEILKIKIDNLIRHSRLLRDKYSEEIKLPAQDRGMLPADEKLLRKIVTYIEENISNPNLTVEEIYTQVGLSKSKMYRKIKETTSKTPVEFLRYMKVKTAAKYLEEKKLSISEVADKVGFQDVAYFRKCFKEEIGMLPSEYLNPKQ
ncbi:hybrid sensor histidine kinase/response regulator [Puteibacter caeruleilacunae]|nr:hybrid sensor histidine kinase/response regulator [Puteibacter caeruleilacunae]